MRCIYCLRSDRPFNGREHVIPQSLGTFTPTSLILLEVCDTCNNGFSKLETFFKEDSVEGFIAAQYQFRNDSSIRFRKDRMKFKNRITGEQRIFDQMFPTLDPETGKAIPAPQIVIEGKNGHCQMIFLKGVRDAKGFADRIKWTGAERSSISIFAHGEDGVGELISELRKRGINYQQSNQELLELNSDGVFDCEFEGRLDQNIMRIIAKIAFNYFAFCTIKSGLGEILYHEDYESIRDFIRSRSESNPVTVTNHGVAMKGHEDRPHIPFHIVRVFESNNRILAEMSLVGHLRYIVNLSVYPFRTGNRRSFGFGHQFDLVKKVFYREDRARYCLGSTSEFNIFSNMAGVIG